MNSPGSLGRARSMARSPHSGSLEDWRRGSGGEVERQIELDHGGRLARNPAARGCTSTGGHEPTEPLPPMFGGNVRRCAATAFINPLRPLEGTVSGNGRGGDRWGPEGATEPVL